MSKCSLCGGEHEPAEYGGVPILGCPSVPESGIYIDTEHEIGPPGELHIGVLGDSGREKQ